ncbi:MAG: CPBP family intramembrane metalloprotease [Deltaproteobacteria bacterium]|nr:CPBP family intramembrane metalloprotease [Deltaproteobacteria bacterium]
MSLPPFIRQFADWIINHFRIIDEECLKEGNERRKKAYITVSVLISSAVFLTCLNYIVLNYDNQVAVSAKMKEFFGGLPDGGVKDFLLRFSPVYKNISWSLGCLFFYFVFPALFARFVLRIPLKELGLSTAGFFRHFYIYILLFIPVLAAVIAVSYTEAFQETYPFYRHPDGIAHLIVWEVFYSLQFFALEFFFRGYIVHSLKWRFGSCAIFVMAVPYCMIHFQKPMAETLAAILAGVTLGVLSLRTNNIFGGVFIHSLVAVSMDVASLIQRGYKF